MADGSATTGPSGAAAGMMTAPTSRSRELRRKAYVSDDDRDGLLLKGIF